MGKMNCLYTTSQGGEIMTITKYDAFIWQLLKINRLRKEKCHGFLGWYSWKITEGKLEESITYINIWPRWGKMILRHEIGHSIVTQRVINASKAIGGINLYGVEMVNADWDKCSWHGILFWRKP
jgi:hypothetical protein